MSQLDTVNTQVRIAAKSGRLPKTSIHRRQEIFWAWLFILPTLLGFLIFLAGPLLAGLGLAFTRYDLFTPPTFAGLDNFRAIMADERILQIFGNTVYYVVGMVIFDLLWALALALAINSQIPAFLKIFFRAVFFFPILVSAAVIAVVWQYLFNADLGVINYYLGYLGIGKIPWLIASAWVKPSVIISTVWNGVGFNMLLLLAGLQGIPKELYEAAAIDGAGRWSSFRKITLPLLSPVIFFILVKGIIGVFQLFDSPFVLTAGGPGDASRSVLMYMYEKAFKVFELGYASALGLVLFLIILLITIIQFAGSKRWVFYR
ncbi:MAG: sugar ABC transporter permease [Caldilinea sp. CFX5]|nr:sugar ABC transporter permease [Caldilinea sp. CFX5]